MEKKGAIFDLDGTLIDSMWVWEKADADFLGRFGYFPDDEYTNVILSCTFSESVNYIKNRYNIDLTIDQITDEIRSLAYEEYANNLVLKPGAKRLLEHMKENGIKLAIATSNVPEMCEMVLKRNGVYHLFEAFVFSDQIGKNKSYPDVYMAAAEKMGLSAHECYIFEDILYAISGAKKSGATVIGVFDEFSAENADKMKKSCHHFIYDYTSLDF